VSRPGLALAPGKGPPVPIVQEAGWAPEPVWIQRLEEKLFRLCRRPNFDHPVVQPVARLYTDWAARLTRMLLGYYNYGLLVVLLYFMKYLGTDSLVNKSDLSKFCTVAMF
jgi:hypothetical protein